MDAFLFGHSLFFTSVILWGLEIIFHGLLAPLNICEETSESKEDIWIHLRSKRQYCRNRKQDSHGRPLDEETWPLINQILFCLPPSMPPRFTLFKAYRLSQRQILMKRHWTETASLYQFAVWGRYNLLKATLCNLFQRYAATAKRRQNIMPLSLYCSPPAQLTVPGWEQALSRGEPLKVTAVGMREWCVPKTPLFFHSVGCLEFELQGYITVSQCYPGPRFMFPHLADNGFFGHKNARMRQLCLQVRNKQPVTESAAWFLIYAAIWIVWWPW